MLLAVAAAIAACASPDAGPVDSGASGAQGSAGVSGGSGAGTSGTVGSGGTTGGGAGTSGTTGQAGDAGGAGTGGTSVAGRGGSGGSAGGAGGRGGGGGTGGRVGNWRVMPLGDSTTASICYRSLLAQMLTQGGHTQYDFVGTRTGDPGCSFTGYDRDNEGHGGYIVADVLKAAGTGTRPGGADTSDPFVSDARDLVTWFDGHPADIAIMHFGTNDVWNNIAPATILNAYSAILTKLRSNNANVRVFVAQITPLNPSGCSACISRVQTLNGMIPGWASTNSTAASRISVVDQFTGFDAAADTQDGVHANANGSAKIAANWYDVLMSIF